VQHLVGRDKPVGPPPHSQPRGGLGQIDGKPRLHRVAGIACTLWGLRPGAVRLAAIRAWAAI